MTVNEMIGCIVAHEVGPATVAHRARCPKLPQIRPRVVVAPHHTDAALVDERPPRLEAVDVHGEVGDLPLGPHDELLDDLAGRAARTVETEEVVTHTDGAGEPSRHGGIALFVAQRGFEAPRHAARSHARLQHAHEEGATVVAPRQQERPAVGLGREVGAGLDESVVESPRVLVVDEVIGLSRRLLSGIEVNRETLAVDVVASVGPGGHYLGEKHTRRHLRASQWRPTVLNRLSREAWEAQGGMDLRARARAKALRILSDGGPQPLEPHGAESLDEQIADLVGRDGSGALDRRRGPLVGV
jgi:trimethylamine--corrinoid protein Co-methyltransferase